ALGGDHDLVAPPFDRLSDHLLAVAEAVGRRGVDEVDAGVDAGAERVDRRPVVAAAPAPSAQRPRAECDDGGVDAAAAQGSLLHVGSSSAEHYPKPRRLVNDDIDGEHSMLIAAALAFGLLANDDHDLDLAAA